MYPSNWPRCRCGDFALDGHLTCGRAECDESGARDVAASARLRAGYSLERFNKLLDDDIELNRSPSEPSP